MMYFVTGTDTDCGKSFISAALLSAVTKHKPHAGTLGIKPVASGCRVTESGLRNPDAELLMAHSSHKLDYHSVNPIAFEPAIAPHIAASNVGVDICPEAIMAKLDLARMKAADFCLVEGAGGWRLPLGNGRFMPEMVQALQLPVVLVVGMKLGCLNHAMLTQEAIKADGLRIAGWVANQIAPEMACYEENLATLMSVMDAPFLGTVPYIPSARPVDAADFIKPGPLLSEQR